MQTLIYGAGVVGQAMGNSFLKSNRLYPGKFSDGILFHDPDKGYDISEENVDNVECILICVPTPFDKTDGIDFSFVFSCLKHIDGLCIGTHVPIIIKSTVMPGTTRKLAERFPALSIFFSPEFLTEDTAQYDAVHPARQIVGYSLDSRAVKAQMLLDRLPAAPFKSIMSSSAAELVKYYSNCFFATKVAFANQMFDIAQKHGIDYDDLYIAACADPMIASEHLEIFHKGFRGFSGKCLPKDLKALIWHMDQIGVDTKILKEVDRYNEELLATGEE